MLDIMYELPSMSEKARTGKKLVITPEVVNNNQVDIKDLLHG